MPSLSDCPKGYEKIVRLLLDHGADVNLPDRDDGNALGAASWAGHSHIVKLLLERGADVNAQGIFHGNVTIAAVRGGSEDILKTLLDNGADMTSNAGATYSPVRIGDRLEP